MKRNTLFHYIFTNQKKNNLNICNYITLLHKVADESQVVYFLFPLSIPCGASWFKSKGVCLSVLLTLILGESMIFFLPIWLWEIYQTKDQTFSYLIYLKKNIQARLCHLFLQGRGIKVQLDELCHAPFQCQTKQDVGVCEKKYVLGIWVDSVDISPLVGMAKKFTS